MATDLDLLVFDPVLGALVLERRLGMSTALDRARVALARPPNWSTAGEESWGRVTPAVVRAILEPEPRCEGALNPAELDDLATAWPPERFWWCVMRSF